MSTAVMTATTAKRIRRFENRIAVWAGGGAFVDGWVLGIVAPALPLLKTELALDPLWLALIGSSALIGVFVGGVAFGPVADRIGRQRLYMLTLLVFLVGSVMQIFVTDAAGLFALRLIMGVAIGADYTLGGPLVGEFVAKARRGPMLSCMVLAWFAGFVFAGFAGTALAQWTDASGLWILATSAVPTLVVVLGRIGTPESPRWLVSKGRVDQAQQIIDRHLDPSIGAEILSEKVIATRYLNIFATRANRRKVLFVGIFWLCQVTPFFAMATFAPQVFTSLGVSDPTLGELVFNLFLVVGCAAGMMVVNKVGRRRLLIWPFVITTVAFLVLAVWPTAPGAVVVVCFAVFALFNAASSVLQTVYPPEVFPTELRATGTGIATAVSRIGAAGGTFLLPLAIASWGSGVAMIAVVVVLVFGTVVSVAWAPETTDLDLSESGAADIGDRHPQGKPVQKEGH